MTKKGIMTQLTYVFTVIWRKIRSRTEKHPADTSDKGRMVVVDWTG